MPQTSFPPSAVNDQMPSEQPEPIIAFGGSLTAQYEYGKPVEFNQPVRLYSMEHEAKTVHLLDYTYDLTKPSDRQALKNIAKGILEAL